jgi:hypothetical protein
MATVAPWRHAGLAETTSFFAEKFPAVQELKLKVDFLLLDLVFLKKTGVTVPDRPAVAWPRPAAVCVKALPDPTETCLNRDHWHHTGTPVSPGLG